MTDSASDSDICRLVRAIEFSAQKHRDQRRKNVDKEPYINHPIGVMSLISELGGVNDIDILMAAVLHDTVEDTDASADDILKLFGPIVAQYVGEVTDDKALPKQIRKEAQVAHAPIMSYGGKMVKLADKLFNTRDLAARPPVGWSKERIHEYFTWAERVVAGLRGTNTALEAALDEVFAANIKPEPE